jgi:uncharacterized membrane protein YccC
MEGRVLSPRTVHAQEAFKLALSMTLFYWLALWMNWDLPKHGALAIILIGLETTGASLRKGVLRVVGTTAGLVVGMLALSLFAQDRLASLVFYSAYLWLIAYRMQGSRNIYAWFVAGFLPLVLWSSTYGDAPSTFHYASFRYLETVAGVVIYTVVSATIWSRRAGEEFVVQGSGVCGAIRRELDASSSRLDGDEPPDGGGGGRAALVGRLAGLGMLMESAITDTAELARRRHELRTTLARARSFCDAMSAWGEAAADCRGLDARRAVPRLDERLARVGERLDRVGELWASLPEGVRGSAAGVPEAAPAPEPSIPAGLPARERSALALLALRLAELESSSSALLAAARAAAGPPRRRARVEAVGAGLADRWRWSGDRALRACFPPLCFVVAFVMWVLLDTPGGAGMPMFAGVMGLAMIMTWMSPIPVLVVLVGTVVLVTAPIYFLVMPALGGGAGLLALVFGYALVIGYLGEVRPKLKMLPLVGFFMVVGISNEQHYSFSTIVNTGLVLSLSFGVIAVVQLLVGPVWPERSMVRSVRRFFRACADSLATYRGSDSLGDAACVRRARLGASVIEPTPRAIDPLVGQLDYTISPGDTPERMGRIGGAMDVIGVRLRAMDEAVERVADAGEVDAEMRAVWRRTWDLAAGLLGRWSTLRFDLDRAERDEVASLRGAIHREAERLAARGTELGHDAYAALGAASGLLLAVESAHAALAPIAWDRWSEERFA